MFIEDLSNGDYPFTQLVQELPGLSLNENFLESIIFFNYHNYDYVKEFAFEAAKDDSGERESVTRCAFGLTVAEFKNCLKLDLIFDPCLFKYDQRLELRNQYISILKSIVTNPNTSVKQINKSQLIEEMNLPYTT